MPKGKIPFSIADVTGSKVLDLTFRSEIRGNSRDADCLFCKQKGKLNIHLIKNAFRCNYCGKSGGMIALYAEYHGVTNQDAYREIIDLLGLNDNNNKYGQSRKRITESASHSDNNHCHIIAEPPKASSEVIHQTYLMLLSSLTLAKPHLDNLLQRGLTHEDIASFGYKSVPAFGQDALCEKLLSAGCILDGVPGFYKNEKDKWCVKLKALGILIPIRSIDGKIAGMQIRLSNPINKRKYIWFSSSGENGGNSSGSPIHFIGDPTAKRVFITEGALKGDIAHALTGYTFICIPGVKSIKSVLLCKGCI
ncbi:MAG: hypothetical protein FWE05_12730 [Defluviitaleaceae bacterium]|nr:hypothetical protein [Defluviitaleaceae bacterium]